MPRPSTDPAWNGHHHLSPLSLLPGLLLPPDTPTASPHSSQTEAFQKEDWITSFPCRPCGLALPPRLPPVHVRPLPSQAPSALTDSKLLSSSKPLPLLTPLSRCCSPPLPAAGSVSSCGSQLQRHLLREALPDHPSQVAAHPLSPHPASSSQRDHYPEQSHSPATCRRDPESQTPGLAGPQLNPQCPAFVLSRCLINTFQINE